MRNAPRASFLIVALTLACVLSPNLALADEWVSVPFVPAFDGAVSFEVTLSDGFTLGTTDLDGPPALLAGGALGYQWMLDPHGAMSVRFRGYAEHSFGSQNGALFGYGGDVGFYLRGYDPQFLYAGAGVFAGGGGSLWDPPEGPSVSGWHLNAGVETNFGMLWFLSPYLFGEIAARASFEYVDLGGMSDERVLVTWALRFDWAFVDQDWVEPQ